MANFDSERPWVLLHNSPKSIIGGVVPPKTPFIMPLPLVVFLGLIAWSIAQLHVAPFSIFAYSFVLILSTTGIAIIVVAFIQFKIHKTSVHPRQFSNNVHLLTTGIFAYSRNPIYLGMLILLCAWTLFCSDWIALIAPIIFFVWMNILQIPVEEFYLQRHFGENYNVYCEKVRRWF